MWLGFDSKRKVRNVTLTRQFQIRYYGWWFILTTCLVSLLCLCIYLLFENQWYETLLHDPVRITEYMVTRARFVSRVVLIGLFVVMGLMILSIVTAHRVAGPILALKKAFLEIQGGNLAYRLKLRREDDLSDLENAFNEMAKSLEAKIVGKS